MSLSRNHTFKNRVFHAGELASALVTTAKMFGADVGLRVRSSGTLADGTKESGKEVTREALERLCDLTESGRSYCFEFLRPAQFLDDTVLSVLVFPDDEDHLTVSFESDSVEALNTFSQAAQEILKFEAALPWSERTKHERGPSLPEQLRAIDERISGLERASAAADVKLACFVSFPFSGPSLEYGRTVARFLELCGARVITGEGYEPKPINQKVRERLAEQLDIVVVIVAGERDSSWTRDEMARAQSPDVFLIPLVEAGASFEQGIFGDHEYISFASGHVADAFIGLLEGVQYAKRVRAARRSVSDTGAT